MKHLQRTFMLGFVCFTLFVFTIVFHMTYTNVSNPIQDFTSTYDSPYNINVDDEVSPLLDNLETAGWIFFMFTFVATIVSYFWGAHQEEHETYSNPYDNNYNRF